MGLGQPATFDRLDLYFYNDGGGVQPPVSYQVQWWNSSSWQAVKQQVANPATPVAGFNTVTFTTVTSTRVRVVCTNRNPVNYGTYSGLTEMEALLV